VGKPTTKLINKMALLKPMPNELLVSNGDNTNTIRPIQRHESECNKAKVSDNINETILLILLLSDQHQLKRAII